MTPGDPEIGGDAARREDVPAHIAIIMDGNGRWARARGHAERLAGHRAAVDTIREITTRCAELGVEQLTLYAFSTENWKRPRTEKTGLFRLLKRFLVEEIPTLLENGVRLSAIGELDRLPGYVRDQLAETRAKTADGERMNLCLALSYGGRREIVDAAREFARRVRDGKAEPEDLDEESFRDYLYQPDMTDPDLVIRTAGEMRISNFLLWEISYSEVWVTEVLWPDFRTEHLEQALDDYRRRTRKFGEVRE